ncbi:polysaccharide export protein [Granulicella sp. WH15]|uniref:polysaccharide biosynthesis/export family protein n=1 Tax=Granulicella sp. WH15 TaxID=2602070 RepID=UPI0013676833|nr:polysaccharide biosynthesis/export family protein [Granulicella sp. WH15]QHN03110.1 polysaccharide export protein [Granulicella sp. WH15]
MMMPKMTPISRRLLKGVLFACMLSSLTNLGHAQFSGPSLSAPSVAPVMSPPTTDPAILYPGPRDLQILPGDGLAIHLFATPDYDYSMRVAIDGTVLLPLIGSVNLNGLTITEAQLLIAKRLKDAGMYRNPQVVIQLIDAPGQFVTITGEMHAVIPVLGERHLFDILAAAGGSGNASNLNNLGATYGQATAGGGGGSTLPPSASHIITILRSGQPKPIVVDIGTDPETAAKANIPIFPRDTIIVSRIGVVYVVGAFKTQGAIPLVQNSPLTLMQVAALSGGVGYEARNNDLRIVRTIGLERKMIQVNILKVLRGKEPDPVLQADDIIFLPSVPIKAAIKSGGLGTVLGAASILSYALINSR